MSQARLIFIGGFLGAGKTTALGALAEHLAASGQRVGVMTNDHGIELVDTATMRAQEFDTEEVSGGSLGSRFELMIEGMKTLEKTASPDVILVEPVGSCTDLVATVIHPLEHRPDGACIIAPISILIDPLRAEPMLGLASGDSFSEKVRYVYRKQLEEADLIVISKADLIDDARLERLRAKLGAEFPQARILAVSARSGQGMKDWFALLEKGPRSTCPGMEIDHATSAEGEALLGWLNATIEFYGAKSADPQAMLSKVLRRIQAELPEVEIAHFKIALRPDGSGDVAVIHVTRRDAEPEVSRRINPPVDTGELIINLRAETAPETLHTALRHAVVELVKEFPGLKTEFAHLHYFRPTRRTLI